MDWGRRSGTPGGEAGVVHALGLRLAAGLLLVGPLLFLATGVHLLGMGVLTWLSTWGTSLLFGACAALCWARVVLVERERGAWSAFAVALSCWAFANFYYALFVAPAPAAVPGPGDIGYFIFDLALVVGLVRYGRVRLQRLPSVALLDALIAALGLAAVAAAVVFKVVSTDVDHTAAAMTTLLYPAEDVLVLAVLVGVGSMLGWRFETAGRLLIAAVVCITIADTLTFGRVLAGNEVGGAWANLGWSAAAALIALAAWRDVGAGRLPRPASPHALGVAAAAGVASVAVLSADELLQLSPVASGLAVCAAMAVIARLVLTVREVRSLADSRRLAMTDELTGLPNRRRFLEDLRAACGSGRAVVLTLFDLDGFKQFNDTFGHPAGDALLASLAGGLAAAVPGGRAYRLGGDEFCTLAPAGERVAHTTAPAIAALSADGPGWQVTASSGSVAIGREADEPSEALRIADHRMYEQKRRRPGAARQQVRDALLGALGEQHPVTRVHTEDVTARVEEVARRLGMSESEVDDTVRAAELHDIGKLAIPASILDKPGPLDESEREVIRTHTLIGERMLLTAPALASIAPLVRASHERWDGGGYPDGLAGSRIPLGARIVAVCDSFDAMTAERPYRPPRTSAEAVAELREGAGSQFDPRVVEAFVATLEQDASPAIRAGA